MATASRQKRKERSFTDPVKAFCDEVYTELEGMRLRLLTMVDEMDMTYEQDEGPYGSFRSHLVHLADQIEWQIQILSHSCPYEWKGSGERVETGVSVPEQKSAGEADFSGGYLGG